LNIASIPLVGRILRGPAFKHRDFRLLLGSATTNYMGYGGEQVVISLLVYQLTGSSAWVGVALALYFLPLFIFGMAAGAIADWIDRQRLLRIIEAVIASNLVVFGTLVAFDATALWQVLVVTFVSGSARAVYLPVRQSYAYDIVGGEQVVAGLGLLTIGMRAGQLVGAVVAGSAMQRLGTDIALYVLATFHGVTFLIVSRLRSIPTEAHSNPVPILENLREYVHEMRRNRTLLMLIVVTAAVEVLGFSFATILPELATDRLGVGAEGLGIMHAVRAAGGFAAGIALAGTVSFRRRGRAMGAWVFAIGAAPVGHLEMGALAASVGVGAALGINGGALILIGILTTIVAPGLRKL
jgi:MFS family permease